LLRVSAAFVTASAWFVSALAAFSDAALAPTLRRMNASDAEDGYDPVIPNWGITKS
jgi:hypothetical protein